MPEFCCSSCGKELKKSYKLCYDCHMSSDLKQCPFIKRSNGERCKLKSINKACIFHKDEKIIKT